jgi:hypothetical protein
MKDNEAGRACGSHGRGEESLQGLGGESQKERDHLESGRPKTGRGGVGVDCVGSG